MAKYSKFQIGMYKYFNKDMRKHQKNLSYRFWKKWENRHSKEVRLFKKHRKDVDLSKWKGGYYG